MQIGYCLVIMLDSYVVVHSMRFAPNDVKGQPLQSSPLQQKRTLINTLSEHRFCLFVQRLLQLFVFLTIKLWRKCWLAIWFLSASSLHSFTSTEELKSQTPNCTYSVFVILLRCLLYECIRIQAFQHTKALRLVLRTARRPAACKRVSSLHLRSSALLHWLQHFRTSPRQ